jgi:hypothetical protein
MKIDSGSRTRRGLRSFVVVGGVLVMAGALAACSESPAPPNADGVAAQAARGTDVVGVWRFVYAGARKQDVEAELATKIADPEQLAAAKREAQQEADASEIEFTAEGWFLSRIAGKEIERMPFAAEKVADDAVRLTMMKGGQTMTTEVEIGTHGGVRRIVIHDPRKGALTFDQR